MSETFTFYNWENMWLKDDHKMTLLILIRIALKYIEVLVLSLHFSMFYIQVYHKWIYYISIIINLNIKYRKWQDSTEGWLKVEAIHEAIQYSKLLKL